MDKKLYRVGPYADFFSQGVEVGNVGAYKGAVFEVLEATNMNIKYKVILHFP